MKKILVIDDDPSLRRATMLVLQKNGYTCLGASDGAEGLALAFAQRPNLVLSDVNMARMDGFGVLKGLRDHPDTAAIPVILMTGQSHKTDARSSMERGADDYLPKPFQMDQLLAAVNARLQRFESAEERNRAERLNAQEKVRLLTSALEAAANGIVITERCGKILWVNQAFTQLTGYDPVEVAGQSLAILKSGQHEPEFYAGMWETVLAGKVWHGELINQRKDGTHYYEEMTITPVRNLTGDIQNFIAIKQDISDRKKFEHELVSDRDLLQALMDNLPDFIYFKDTNSRFTRLNPALARHFGLPDPKEALGKTDADFFPIGASRQKLVDERRVLITGEPLLGRVEEVAQGGKKILVSTTKVPIRGKDGNIVGLVGISRDITEYRQAEIKRQMMELQLRQAQKLESIGQLAAGIAHEINTPVQYVGDNIRFVQEAFTSLIAVLQNQAEVLAAVKQGACTPELLAKNEALVAVNDVEYFCSQIPQAVAESLEGVGRISNIVRSMKEFSHPGGKEKCLADLNKAIESTITVARNEWKYVADLTTDLDPNLPLVPCFLGEFNQVVLNLVVNASHAISDAIKGKLGAKGAINIRTRRDGEQVEIRIKDSGTGIPEAHREKIFEPFFTTKGVGKGTGQGLSIAYNSIVNQHGGELTFETETGRGTTFIIRLPLRARTATVSATGGPVS